MKIYLSAPLFTQGQRLWNRMLAGALEERIAGAEVLLPQDTKFGSSYNQPADFSKIFQHCLEAVDDADLMVAVLDGADVDSGTAYEMGYARARAIPIIGVRTDYRASQDRGVNLMIAQGCTEVLRAMSFGEDPAQLVKDLCGKIVSAIRRLDNTGQKG